MRYGATGSRPIRSDIGLNIGSATTASTARTKKAGVNPTFLVTFASASTSVVSGEVIMS